VADVAYQVLPEDRREARRERRPRRRFALGKRHRDRGERPTQGPQIRAGKLCRIMPALGPCSMRRAPAPAEPQHQSPAGVPRGALACTSRADAVQRLLRRCAARGGDGGAARGGRRRRSRWTAAPPEVTVYGGAVVSPAWPSVGPSGSPTCRESKWPTPFVSPDSDSPLNPSREHCQWLTAAPQELARSGMCVRLRESGSSQLLANIRQTRSL
jgi:hypothetical protein